MVIKPFDSHSQPISPLAPIFRFCSNSILLNWITAVSFSESPKTKPAKNDPIRRMKWKCVFSSIFIEPCIYLLQKCDRELVSGVAWWRDASATMYKIIIYANGVIMYLNMQQYLLAATFHVQRHFLSPLLAWSQCGLFKFFTWLIYLDQILLSIPKWALLLETIHSKNIIGFATKYVDLSLWKEWPQIVCNSAIRKSDSRDVRYVFHFYKIDVKLKIKLWRNCPFISHVNQTV